MSRSRALVPVSKPKTGRPSCYSAELGLRICTALAEGKSLRAISRMRGMPSKRTVLRWLFEDHEGFRVHYARAREAQAEVLAEEIRDIADEVVGDQDSSEQVNRARLRVDARKWIASRLLPKKYGDFARLEHAGADGGPIQVMDAREKLRARLAGRSVVPSGVQEGPLAHKPH